MTKSAATIDPVFATIPDPSMANVAQVAKDNATNNDRHRVIFSDCSAERVSAALQVDQA